MSTEENRPDKKTNHSLSVFFSRAFCLGIFAFSRLFYRFDVDWVSPPPNKQVWDNIRVFAFLNHTSLLEPLFFGAFPLRFIWNAASRTTVPGADITMNRRFAGFFYRFLSLRTVSITRKRDGSWQRFLDQIQPTDLVALTPEGRMMRANGLDKHGNPMTVRGGITDILMSCEKGLFLLGYSGGLHHVNKPGQKGFKLFKTLKMRYEIVDIESYLDGFKEEDTQRLRDLVSRDLESRLLRHKPQ